MMLVYVFGISTKGVCCDGIISRTNKIAHESNFKVFLIPFVSYDIRLWICPNTQKVKERFCSTLPPHSW